MQKLRLQLALQLLAAQPLLVVQRLQVPAFVLPLPVRDPLEPRLARCSRQQWVVPRQQELQPRVRWLLPSQGHPLQVLRIQQ